MLSLADVLKVIQDCEPVEVLVINANIAYNPRTEKMDKEWCDYEVLTIYSDYDRESIRSYTVISVREVNNA